MSWMSRQWTETSAESPDESATDKPRPETTGAAFEGDETWTRPEPALAGMGQVLP